MKKKRMMNSDCNEELLKRLDAIIEQNKTIIELLSRDKDIDEDFEMTETKQTHSTNINLPMRKSKKEKGLYNTDRASWKEQLREYAESVK